MDKEITTKHDSADVWNITLTRRGIGAFSVYAITPPKIGFHAGRANRGHAPVPGLLISTGEDELYIRGVRLISDFINALVGEKICSAGFIEDLMYFNGDCDDFSEFLYNLIIDDIGFSEFNIEVKNESIMDPETRFQTRDDWLSVVSVSPCE